MIKCSLLSVALMSPVQGRASETAKCAGIELYKKYKYWNTGLLRSSFESMLQIL